MIFSNSITLLQMDRLQLTADNTSNDVFSRCKSVHKMATGKGDDQLKQYDNKLELGTRYKLKLGPN